MGFFGNGADQPEVPPFGDSRTREQIIDEMREGIRDPHSGPVIRQEWERGRWLPARVAADAVLARTETAALVLNGVACCPWGYIFAINAVPRPGHEHEAGALLENFPREMIESMPPEVRKRMGVHLTERVGERRISVELADGAQYEVEDTFAAMARGGPWGAEATSPDATPTDINQRSFHSMPASGSGVQTTLITAWGLPPPGPVRLTIEWEAAGFSSFSHDLDGSAILEGAKRAQRREDFGSGVLLGLS